MKKKDRVGNTQDMKSRMGDCLGMNLTLDANLRYAGLCDPVKGTEGTGQDIGGGGQIRTKHDDIHLWTCHHEAIIMDINVKTDLRNRKG